VPLAIVEKRFSIAATLNTQNGAKRRHKISTLIQMHETPISTSGILIDIGAPKLKL